MHNKQQLAEFLRVDHAGERAAQTIFEGQLAVLKKPTCGSGNTAYDGTRASPS